MRTEPAKCCGKRRYRTRARAEVALTNWQEIRGRNGPVRTYRCENGYWHLTHLSQSQYRKAGESSRKDMLRRVIKRDERCVVCGEASGILDIHPRVPLTGVNDGYPSSYITAHHQCLHHSGLSSDEKFYRGYKLDPHMSHSSTLYPVWNYDHWYHLNEDGTVTQSQERIKR